jgi:hypothetical protein
MIRPGPVATIAIALLWQCNLNGADSPPRFEDYPAAEVWHGKNAPIILGKNDRRYRTRLRLAANERPNFANHYILTTWGCGAECLVSVIIDANTRHVYWAPHTICCWPPNVQPIQVHADSRLIAYHGIRNEKDGDNAAHYYEFTGGKFIHIKSMR